MRNRRGKNSSAAADVAARFQHARAVGGTVEILLVSWGLSTHRKVPASLKKILKEKEEKCEETTRRAPENSP